MRVHTHQHQKTSLLEYCLVHHNIFCVTRSPFAFRDIITPCLRSGISRISLSTPHSVRGYHRSLAFGDIADIAQHTTFQKSPYAYGGQDQSPYANGDHMSCNPRMHTGITSCDPCMHTGIKNNPRMHTGITKIPVCIWGSRSIPVCIRGSHVK
jgi:hypothetical protein